MRWFSILAVYVLIWVLSAFFVLPWGVRSHDDDEAAERVAGQVTSAPVNFRPGRIVLRATLLSLVLAGLFFANLHYGWIKADIVEDIVPVPDSLKNQTLYQ
ncbi:MAG: DUF1467 family protein [Sphingomonadales bacterium]|nr:DUF1467 family protein [Sphingomonadales bacterium]